MLSKRLAAVGVAVVFVLGVIAAPANADPRYDTFQAQDTDLCLDYRSDFGPYVTGCNSGGYQQWLWNDLVEATAMRQQATRLCLTVRSGEATMKPCLAADQAALWIMSPGAINKTIRNKATGECLARKANNRVSTAPCTGGLSQRWALVV